MSAAEPRPPVRPDPGDRDRFAGLADLSSAYFGMVMATGIVSLAGRALGLSAVARVLLPLNIAVYAVLWILMLVRALRYPRRFFGDLVSHQQGPGFFTAVAATAILASQLIELVGDTRDAVLLAGVALVLWVVLTYAIFAGLALQRNKPALEEGIGGSWLLAVVATQSLAVLAALLAAGIGGPYKLPLNFFALSLWLWGGMLYIWMTVLIFYRYNFFVLAPQDFAPPYWITMGAMAISTLAGSLLVANAPQAPFLRSLLPFIEGFTVFYWAAGTWWIPLLVVLLLWRHLWRRFPLVYDPLYWAAVFPLGMYAAGTDAMRRAMGLDFLRPVPEVFLYVALAAWLAVLAGLLRRLIRAALRWAR